MRVVTVVSLLLVCSVLSPSAVLADPVATSGVTAPSSSAVDDASVAAVQSTQTESSQSDQSNRSNQSNQSSGSLGLQVSSFVQSTTAETNGVVENEMWEANVNRSGRPAEVTRRVDRLDRRVTSLRDRRQSLADAYENGSLSTLRYRAQLARLNGELNALSAAASSAERAATRFNTNPRGLSEVRTEIQRSRSETPPLGWQVGSNNGENRNNTTNATQSGSNNGENRGTSVVTNQPTRRERNRTDGTAPDSVEKPNESGGPNRDAPAGTTRTPRANNADTNANGQSSNAENGSTTGRRGDEASNAGKSASSTNSNSSQTLGARLHL